MTRQDVLEKTKRIIFDCFPDMEETGIQEKSVSNHENALDARGSERGT